MCGRYAFFDEEEAYEARKILEDIARGFGQERAQSVKKGEVFPSDTAAVRMQSPQGPIADAARWGLPMPNKKGLVINAKSETVFDRPLFKNNILWHKCLIPASAFYEWEKREGKNVKRTVRVRGKRLFYLCGLYARVSAEGAPENRFVILTQPANEAMRALHGRMPVIAPEAREKDWLCETHRTRALLEEILAADARFDIV